MPTTKNRNNDQITDTGAKVVVLMPKDRLQAVRELMMTAYSKISQRELSIADFIRLLSLEKEMAGEEQVQELKVTWVHSFETGFDS